MDDSLVPWGDPSILRQILREARYIRDPHAAEAFRRAAVQTGLVESGGRNLRRGDADSLGWRQERASLYPNPLNVRASVRRFRREFEQFYRPGLKSYQLAAMIQRPREDLRGRYRDVAREAARILRGAGGGAQAGGNAPSGASALIQAGAGGGRGMPVGSTGVSALIEALMGKQAAPSGGALQAPAFAAGPRFAGQLPQGGGGPVAKPDIGALLAAVQTAGGDVPHGGVGGASAQIPLGATGGVRAPGRGRAVVSPGADRPGVPTSRAVLAFVRQISALYGRPLRIGTGSNHSRLTVNGNVSDHWSGHAADIPLRGRALIRAGQDALIAAGMPERQARKQRGGLYNVGRYEIIFASNQGGNHFTHLHVGVQRR